MDKNDFPSDSDVSDEDYVPDNTELPSEVESEGEVEDEPLEEDNDENLKSKRGKKRTKKTKQVKKKKQKPEPKEEENETEDQTENSKTVNVEEQKKYEESLWADFLKDTNTKPKKTTDGATNSTATDDKKVDENNKTNETKTEKVCITKVYEFAGEEIKVTKEVPVDSIEARISVASPTKNSSASPLTRELPIPLRTSEPPKHTYGRGRSSLGAVLGKLGKKTKINTLEKSKLDWDRYKQEEGLNDELQLHNKGKDGYLERQDFLQRTDLRQFELEKKMRATTRRNLR